MKLFQKDVNNLQTRLDELDDFNKRSVEAEWTDTAEVWDHIDGMRRTLREILHPSGS